MTSISKPSRSSLSCSDRKQNLRQQMQQCRQMTLALFSTIDEDTFCAQAHPDFSPIGWHLGHIAYTEHLWLLEHCARRSPQAQDRRLFAADGLPKCDRVRLPSLAETQAYLQTVRTEVFDYLDVAPLDEQERLWRWLLQHESQHGETIAIVLALLDRQQAKITLPPSSLPLPPSSLPLYVPAGEFTCGNDAIAALDNERPAHPVYLDAYGIDRRPVTCQEYRIFMRSGGYQEPGWWTAEGWDWLRSAGVAKPLYGSDNPDCDARSVYGVSWYEADAYARFVGKRLPTEQEWEAAARYYDRDSAWEAGDVWQWTDSWFAGYPGFEAYPYRGYSQAYFDGQHRVLRGGSWATRSWARRRAFRNWYHPHVREMFAGFRCAMDVSAMNVSAMDVSAMNVSPIAP